RCRLRRSRRTSSGGGALPWLFLSDDAGLLLDNHDQLLILFDRTCAAVSDPKCLSMRASVLSRWRSDTPRASSSQPKTQLLITPSNPTAASAAKTASYPTSPI